MVRRRKLKRVITAERLRELLSYDEDTGVFTWLEDRAPLVKAGDVAGTLLFGYVRIAVDCRIYAAHRLAWLYMTDEWPPENVNHRDDDRSNNSWSNLRPATRSQTQWNQGPQRNNKAGGLKGVFFDKRAKQFCARIGVKRKYSHLGYFPTAELAHRAYCRAARKLHGEFARTD